MEFFYGCAISTNYFINKKLFEMSEEQPEVKNQDESQEKSEHINVKVVNAVSE